MTTPGVVPGGDRLYTDANDPFTTITNDFDLLPFDENEAQRARDVALWNKAIPDTSPYADSMGQFALHPGATPKYALNRGPRDNENRETLARMFVQMTEQERAQFVKSVPLESQPLAEVLCAVGSGGTGGTGFIDFVLTQAVEPFQEKFQVVESLSDNFVVYLFGQQAPTFQYAGFVYNTYQDDQRIWLMRLYRDILRGTQLARRRKLVRLRYDSVIVSGIFVGFQETLLGEAADYAQFSLTMIPTQYIIHTAAVGKPTRLKNGYTVGSETGLSTLMPLDTNQRSVTQIAESGDRVRRPNEKVDVPYRKTAPSIGPAQVLEDRLMRLDTVVSNPNVR